MSRYCHDIDFTPALDAAVHWRDHALLVDGSVFSEAPLWRKDHLEALKSHFVDKPMEGDAGFYEKLAEQLGPALPEVKQLAAEMLWLMLLCPSNVGREKKREGVRRVWEWSGSSWPQDSPWLTDQVMRGVGSAGPGYNTNRWRELVFFIRAMLAFKQLPVGEQNGLMNDGWAFAEWLGGIADSEARQLRHMLLFLLFPERFERVFGGGDRQKIVRGLGNIPQARINKMSPLEIDRELARVRREWAVQLGTENFDFYEPYLKVKWREPKGTEAIAVEEIESEYEPRRGACTNLIFYGPPGTGKTFRLNQLKKQYTDTQDLLSREAWLTQQLLDVRWFDAIFAALYDLGGKASVKDIAEHDYLQFKARAHGRTQFLKNRIWATLQAHTVLSSTTVNYKTRQSPQLFDKTEDSLWYFVEGWEEQSDEELDLAEAWKAGPSRGKAQERFTYVTFHQAYSYEDFIEGLRPERDSESGDLTYNVIPGVFRLLCQKAKSDPKNSYAIFIDEINRGNIAKILGELITLMEPDKRAVYTVDGRLEGGMEVVLPYSGDRFGVPANLDIYGAMNTADRSIALLDTALRRRFRFMELMPSPVAIKGADEAGSIDDGAGGIVDLRALFSKLNQRIRFLLNRNMTLGHAYFMGITDFDDLRDVLLHQVIPLLQEYFYEDWRRIQLVFGDIGPGGDKRLPQIICHEELDEATVLGFGHDLFENRIEYRVADAEEITPEAVRKIYEA